MADSAERLFTGQTGQTFVTLTLVATVVKTGRYVLPPLMPTIIIDLGIMSFMAGIALTTMTVLYAVTQYPSGRVSDQLSRKTLLAAVGCVSLALALLSMTPVYLVLLVGAALLGVDDGLFSPPARARLSDLFAERRGQAFAVRMVALDIGGVAASGLAGAVLVVAVWQAAFVPLGLLLALFGLLYLTWDRERVVLATASLDARATVRRLATF